MKRHEAVLFLCAFYLVILIGGMAGNAIGAVIVKILPEQYQKPPEERVTENAPSCDNANETVEDEDQDTQNTEQKDNVEENKKNL